jgi:hypothetical protein
MEPTDVGRGSLSLPWLAAAAIGVASGESPEAAPRPHLPSEYQQVLPRARIASINRPEFVLASEADLPDDAWVFGVEIDGVAKAYSLNLLNRHEIVNDSFGERPVAAVW